MSERETEKYITTLAYVRKHSHRLTHTAINAIKYWEDRVSSRSLLAHFWSTCLLPARVRVFSSSTTFHMRLHSAMCLCVCCLFFRSSSPLSARSCTSHCCGLIFSFCLPLLLLLYLSLGLYLCSITCKCVHTSKSKHFIICYKRIEMPWTCLIRPPVLDYVCGLSLSGRTALKWIRKDVHAGDARMWCSNAN